MLMYMDCCQPAPSILRNTVGMRAHTRPKEQTALNTGGKAGVLEIKKASIGRKGDAHRYVGGCSARVCVRVHAGVSCLRGGVECQTRNDPRASTRVDTANDRVVHNRHHIVLGCMVRGPRSWTVTLLLLVSVLQKAPRRTAVGVGSCRAEFSSGCGSARAGQGCCRW